MNMESNFAQMNFNRLKVNAFKARYILFVIIAIVYEGAYCMPNREQILFISYSRVKSESIRRSRWTMANQKECASYIDTFYQDRTLSIKVLKCRHEFSKININIVQHAKEFENVTIPYFLFTQQILHDGI